MGETQQILTSLADETARIALGEFARSAVQRLVGPRVKGRKNDVDELAQAVRSVLARMDQSRFGRQVADAAAWASLIHVQGMVAPIETGTTTIALDMATVQRRFRAGDRPDEVIGERELINSSSSFLVLGEPGSGKTTALKRLTLSMFDEIPTDPSAELAFPIVLVCREVNWNRTGLTEQLAERFGVDLLRLCEQLGAQPGERPVLVAELMDQTKCLLIIDGLDEVGPKHRAELLDEVARLRRLLTVSRVVCSSRSGDAPHLEGFLTAELLPLTSQQRADIVSRQLGDDVGFFDRVEQSGVDEQLMDRPLFLNHLIRVFEATGAIADRPTDLYSQLIRLMIHEWDEQRRVRRRPSIGGLDATTMDAILREIAFRLTTAGLALFHDSDLHEIAADIGRDFELGNVSGRRLMREIQANAGFVIETPTGFQFTHFTLQEHLCAHNVVLRPNHRTIERLLSQNPEIAAVAVALSSHPTDWLLDRIQVKSFDTGEQVATFVGRLGQERPRFHESAELGSRLLQLMARCSMHDARQWEQLAAVPSAAGSVARALRPYHLLVDGARVELSIRRELPNPERRRIPRFVVPLATVEKFPWPEGDV